MIGKIDPSTIFFTFTSIERLWDPFIKVLHTLHGSKLNLPHKIKNLQFIHKTKLIWINLVTCAIYCNHKAFSFHKLITKYYYPFGHINSKIYFVIEFENHESEHDHGLLWIKNAPTYGMHTNEKIEWFVNMYIYHSQKN
jgi:hypothetical protein